MTMPHYLEAALSFKSIKDLDKKYSKFFNEITMGYEVEVSGGELLDNSNREFNIDSERESFNENFEYSETEFLRNLTEDQLLDDLELKPVYGFAKDKFYQAIAQYIEESNEIEFEVMSEKREDQTFVTNPLKGYGLYSGRREIESFIHETDRSVDMFMAKSLAIEQTNLLVKFIKTNPIASTESIILNDIRTYAAAMYTQTIFIKDYEEATANNDYKRTIFGFASYLKDIKYEFNNLLKFMSHVTSNWCVLDEKGKLNVLRVDTYSSDLGIRSPLLSYNKDEFDDLYEIEKDNECDRQWERHLDLARENFENDDNANYKDVIKTIYRQVVKAVDNKAEYDEGYHQVERLKGKVTVVESDSSIKPAGAEIVSPVFNGLSESFKWLDKVFDMIEEHGMETNNSTGLHVNIGTFKSLAFAHEKAVNLNNPTFATKPTIDVLKLAVLSGDHYLLEQFDRLGNTYARSLASNIRDLASNGFDFKQYNKGVDFNGKIISMRDCLVNLNKQLIVNQADRYRTINMQHLIKNGYLEFRIAGGDNYHVNDLKVKKAIYRYAQLCAIACDPQAYFKEYMTELYRRFVDSTPHADIKQSVKQPRPKDINEAMYYIRSWNSKHSELNSYKLDSAVVGRLTRDIRGKKAFETDIYDLLNSLRPENYRYVDVNFLWSIRLLMLYSVKNQPNPRQVLKDLYAQYKDTSIKNYLIPRMSINKPQWIRFFFTGQLNGE